MRLLPAIAAIALLAPSLASAAGLSYNNVKVEYIKDVPDDTDIEADGLGIGVSALLNKKVFLLASYAQIETDQTDFPQGTFELSQLAAGLGLRSPLSRTADIVASATLLRAEVEGKGAFAGAKDDDTGFEFTLGARSLLGNAGEFGVGLGYLDVFDGNTTYVTLDAVIAFTATLGLTGRMEISDDEKIYRAGLRLAF